jgi:predicted dehydrogenase
MGILGASRVAKYAIVAAAKECPAVRVVGIASRDLSRAQAYAAEQGIAHAFGSYEQMLRSDDVDAIYVALPNSHHCEWSVKALEAGKHVLCEKPFCANAVEAARMLAAAERTGGLLMEAYHSGFHPAYRRLREIVQSGELGRIERVEVKFLCRVPPADDLRFRYELGGGAAMDVGSYAVHLTRFVMGEEPRVLTATATLVRPDVDGRMDAALAFPSGAQGAVACSLVERLWNFRFTLKVVGTEGSLRVTNPWAPQMVLHSITVIDKQGRKRRDPVSRRPSTYVHQLRAFADATTNPTGFPATDSLRTMEIIDQLYLTAGLPLRGKRLS